MKKLLVVLLVVCMVFTVGCKKKVESDPIDNTEINNELVENGEGEANTQAGEPVSRTELEDLISQLDELPEAGENGEMTPERREVLDQIQVLIEQMEETGTVVTAE